MSDEINKQPIIFALGHAVASLQMIRHISSIAPAPQAMEQMHKKLVELENQLSTLAVSLFAPPAPVSNG